mgnify:CR=1 FL=1
MAADLSGANAGYVAELLADYLEAPAHFGELHPNVLKTLDAAKVVAAMDATKLAEGAMVLMSAQYWFELLMMEYLEKHANAKGRKQAAMRQFLQLRASGVSTDLSGLKRQMKAQIDAAIKSDMLKPSEAMRLLDDYERGLREYTYLTI